MKALSVMPEYAMPILYGEKTIEYRSWKTDYRGDLLICASSRRFPGAIDCHAICVAELTDIEVFTRRHLHSAQMDEVPVEKGGRSGYAWHLENIRLIKPFKQKGKLHLYDVLDSKIKILNDGLSEAWCLEKFYYPLAYKGGRNSEQYKYEIQHEWRCVINDREDKDKLLKRVVPEIKTVGACFTSVESTE